MIERIYYSKKLLNIISDITIIKMTKHVRHIFENWTELLPVLHHSFGISFLGPPNSIPPHFDKKSDRSLINFQMTANDLRAV